ncbi:MAG: ABC transporter permease subunit [Candidatus Saccharibacteria bacterium]|nr:ABC transporter permease subunit [Candidatus Saccharibacteria bacterium]
MNIYRRELRAHYKVLIVWMIWMVFLIISGMYKFQALSANDANGLLKVFPKSLQVIFGISGFNLSTMIGAFGILFLYIILTATIHATMLGAEIISKEERDRTSEFLFPKPVSRNLVVTQKLLAAVTNVVVLNLVTLVTSILTVAAFAKDFSNNGMVIVLCSALLFMQLLFLSIGAVFAGILKNSKVSASIATAILLGTYVMWVVIDLNKNLEFMKYLTPFKYFDASVIIHDGHLDVFYVSLSVILTIVLIITTYLAFNKRDLKV